MLIIDRLFGFGTEKELRRDDDYMAIIASQIRSAFILTEKEQGYSPAKGARVQINPLILQDTPIVMA